MPGPAVPGSRMSRTIRKVQAVMIYHVTYKNRLKSQKNRADYLSWLRANWQRQKKWGATSYRLWTGREKDRRFLFCRYTVNDLERWTESASSPKNRDLIMQLGRIIDMDHMSVKITLHKPHAQA